MVPQETGTFTPTDVTVNAVNQLIMINPRAGTP